MLTRRSFLTNVVGLLCAPAIVRAESLMPVRSPRILRGYTAFDAGVFYCPYIPLQYDGPGVSPMTAPSPYVFWIRWDAYADQ